MEESLIHFETDLDCKVYKFGNFLCEVKCGRDVCTSFRKGSFKLKFVSSLNSADYYETIYNVEEAGIETFYTIRLKPIQDKRLLEEQKEREKKTALQKKAEQERKQLERLRAEQQRKEDALKQAQSQFIDLGLSVKWSTCNLGSTTPEKPGHFYAWGETISKTSFGAGLYKHFKPADHYAQFESVLKYNTTQLMNDNKTHLDSIDDAATMQLGKGYRIPTEKEWKELILNCLFTKSVLNGVDGYIVKSRVKGYENSSIFLPMTGIYSWTGYHKEATCYWTSDLGKDADRWNEHAVAFILKYVSQFKTELWTSEEYRYCGFPIRPVFDLK